MTSFCLKTECVHVYKAKALNFANVVWQVKLDHLVTHTKTFAVYTLVS